MIRLILLLGTCIAAMGTMAPVAASADEVRYFTENNTLYRETRRFVERPVTEAQAAAMVAQPQAAPSATAKQQYHRARWVQVVEYRYEPIWGTYCSSTCQPCLIPRWVPYTRWVWQQEAAPVMVESRTVGLAPQTASFWPGNRTRYVVEEVVERVPIAQFGGKAAAATAGSGRPQSSPIAATTAAASAGSVAPSSPTTPRENPPGGTSGFQWADGMPAYGSSADRGSTARPANDRTTISPTPAGPAAPNDPRTGSPMVAPGLVSPGSLSSGAGGAASPSTPPPVLSVPSRPGPTAPAPPSGIAPPYSIGSGSNAAPPLPAATSGAPSAAAVPSAALPQGAGGYTPPTAPTRTLPSNASPNTTYAPPGGFSPLGFGGGFGATGAGTGSAAQSPTTQPFPLGAQPGTGGFGRGGP